MRLFYVTKVKRFVLIGALTAVATGIILRFLLKDFATREVMLHTAIRNQLGHPFAYYSQSALLLLVLLYEYYYAVIGGIMGYLFFRLKHRHSGFTLFFTRTFKTGSVIILLILSYLFLRVDLINRYDATIMATVPHPAASQVLSTKFFKTLAYFFLPSLTAAPDRGFPKAQQSAAEQTAATNTGSQQAGSQPVEQPGGAFIPIPTANTQPLPPQSGNTSIPAPQGGLPSPDEILGSLNVFRLNNGLQALQWDGGLTGYAQTRANFYAGRGSIDGGAGFNTYKGQNGPFPLGFQDIGEMSNFGVSQTADGLIVNYFGAFPGTRSVELNNNWKYAGVGVNGTGIDIVVGSRKCIKVERAQCY